MTDTPAHTPLPWHVVEYDAGDRDYYDHNGPCPGIFPDDKHDTCIIHWDGFKQQYWSSANGDQKQIEANAAFIVLACNSHYALLEALRQIAAPALVPLDRLPGHDQPNGWRDIAVQRIDIARAALSQAGGASE